MTKAEWIAQIIEANKTATGYQRLLAGQGFTIVSIDTLAGHLARVDELGELAIKLGKMIKEQAND
jgi:hypothetical protein